MIIEYFSQLNEEDLKKFLDAYEEALQSNVTEFIFNDYNVTTTFANQILRYNNIFYNENGKL
tara:strand:+ start:237 stop:422 length:186 start_codon:yes stop_codon:yes gene_type:complete